MLAFDIETLGLMHTKPLPPITCVCLYSATTQKQLRFFKVTAEVFEQNKETLIECLDKARRLAGFNAVLFDLAYIGRFFDIDGEKMNAWIQKCMDPFTVCKFILKNTCGLNHLLVLNHLPCKTGSGAEAIELAKQERWDELLDYCLMDARLTYDLCALSSIAFGPLLRGQVDAEGHWRFHCQAPAPTESRVVWDTVQAPDFHFET